MTRAALALATILALGACEPLPEGPPPLRDTTAQIASQTDIDFDDLAGEWRIIAAPEEATLGRRGDRVALVRGSRDMLTPAPLVIEEAAPSEEEEEAQGEDQPQTEETTEAADTAEAEEGWLLSVDGVLYDAIENGPGRLLLEIAPRPQPFWVLWADADRRTVAVGAPGGEIGFIMERGAVSGDRLRAALEILEWYGYAPESFAAGVQP